MGDYKSEKRCCNVCDARKVCHVCGQQTLMACSDCQINFHATVYVCGKAACRDAHERKCYGDGNARAASTPAPALVELPADIKTLLLECADKFTVFAYNFRDDAPEKPLCQALAAQCIEAVDGVAALPAAPEVRG